TVSVTVVMRGYVPAIRMDEEESLTLSAGSSFDLNPKVYFKGVETSDSDVSFIYTVTDAAVASVVDGTVTALAAGETQITVTASWRGLGGSGMVGSEDALGLKITLDLTVLTVD
ncbi:MAG: Ig-like domain-containing protein, partial [Clostridia bacterium]|nr:Ig-like domain-containing protein [Clostridia bacterium]